VLLIEDELTIGQELQSALSEAGFAVDGPVVTVDDAVCAAEEGEYDAAVLDANLNGQNAGSIAAVLIERRVPFVVVSGYAREFLPLNLAHAPLIAKPFNRLRLVATVRQLCGEAEVR